MRFRLNVLSGPILLLLVTVVGHVNGAVVYVAQDRCTPPGAGSELDPFCLIQDGIDAAVALDTVLVEPGLYAENVALTAKSLTIRSTGGAAQTIISGEGLPNTVLTITNIPPPFFIVDGFTVTGGSNDSGIVLGGGLLIFHSFGGEIRNCIFRGNTALRGGGFFNFGSEPLFTNCIFQGNHADDVGGGIYNDHGIADFTNCAVVGNSASVEAGGMYIAFTPTVANSVFWGNTDAACGTEPAQIFVAGSWEPSITYCNIEGLDQLAGEGNIGVDPMFVDVSGGNLRTLAGSPCHDAGTNAFVTLTTDIAGASRIGDDPNVVDTGDGDGAIVDIGAYEFHPAVTAVASGDCNANGVPDRTEPDCNGSGVPDDCDIADGTSEDVNGNDVPDECESPIAVAEGPRYMQILPAVVEEPVAIHIASPELSCLDAYVTADGHLDSAPTYMMPHHWHMLGISVSDASLVPGTTYEVSCRLESGEITPARTVTLWASGDVDNNGLVSFLDILLVVQGVSGNFCNISEHAADLDGCAPNGVVNIADALRAVHAFQDIPYGAFCPLPCSD